MPTIDRVREDLEYVTNAVRREDRDDPVPAIYLMWAVLVAIGFALPDFAPRWAAWYWFTIGPAGGLASWWLGARQGARDGIKDLALERRHAHHWLWAGLAFILVFLPALTGSATPAAAATNILLVAGLAYGLAGVHLERGLRWSGLLMLGGYVALSVLALPYLWTTTGLVVAASLIVAAFMQRKAPPIARE